MIIEKNKSFHLQLATTSYIIEVDDAGHLRHHYFGPQIEDQDWYFLVHKENFPLGGNITYDEKKFPNLSYSQLPLEYSSLGYGDYRHPSVALTSSNGDHFDFVYDTHHQSDRIDGQGLPTPHDVDQVLVIDLVDHFHNVRLRLQYGLFIDSDVIVRNVELINEGGETITINKLASFSLDMVNDDYQILTPYGGWISEFQIEKRRLPIGLTVHQSTFGSSSANHNPFFLLLNNHATLTSGNAYGFNLIYSGSHQATIERTSYDNVRVSHGLNPYDFHPTLGKDERISTPFGVITMSNRGQNGVSHNFHHFTKRHVVRRQWAFKDRPIAINSWEANYFDFNEKSVLKFIKSASEVPVELFVLDDGWFGKRDNDTSGLGDWQVNKKKLPHGLNTVANGAHKAKMMFGLWFEPEMVNEDSDLYRRHPDWALKSRGEHQARGRHQLILDLTQKEVQDFIIDSISAILDATPIGYVKWDFNRPFATSQSTVTHDNQLNYRYYVGLYRVLDVLMNKYPDILWENCASGGGRFDLGMMTYFDQTWVSDNTDGYHRQRIQAGASIVYPLSLLSNHVSGVPGHQLLRVTPLSTRLNLASFGVLGLELEIDRLTGLEKKQVKEHLMFYRQWKHLFQHGDFYQLKTDREDRFTLWQIINKERTAGFFGFFQALSEPLLPTDVLFGYDLGPDKKYVVTRIRQDNPLQMFGTLIKMGLPKGLDIDGVIVKTLMKTKTAQQMLGYQEETYTLTGKALMEAGIRLTPQWMGNGFDGKTRVLGDFGSNLYYFQAIE